ncbi:MAG: hydroxymethylbilane synthase [Actinobacteria bacterium QS_8_72_14]|nr:MAG: hydroxymethylbilane synthase [Actinobacteria bacterium QS_8_72_14]
MLRLATRRSSLARAQTFGVGRLLAQATGDDFELVAASTTGDDHPEQAVAAFDAKGLFVDGTRRAVLDGRADLVVHSAKDLPSGSAEGLALAAVPPRADPRDALVTRDERPLGKLAAGAVVGTSSERRRVQLQAAAPQLEVVGLRGNLDTRLRKVADGTLDACVVAMAGLQRMLAPREQGGVGALEVGVRIAALEPGECLPAPAQGALAVEARTDDAAARAAAARVDDRISHTRLLAERALLAGRSRHRGAGAAVADRRLRQARPAGPRARRRPHGGPGWLRRAGAAGVPRPRGPNEPDSAPEGGDDGGRPGARGRRRAALRR